MLRGLLWYGYDVLYFGCVCERGFFGGFVYVVYVECDGGEVFVSEVVSYVV